MNVSVNVNHMRLKFEKKLFFNGTNGFNSPMFFINIRGNESKDRLEEKLSMFITEKIGFVNFMHTNKR